MHLVMSISYLVVLLLPSGLSSASMVMAYEKLALITFQSHKMAYLSRANGLAKFACNASFFTTGIASQQVLTSETRTQGSLLKRIINRNFGSECSLKGQPKASHNFRPEKDISSSIKYFTPRSMSISGSKILSFFLHGLMFSLGNNASHRSPGGQP